MKKKTRNEIKLKEKQQQPAYKKKKEENTNIGSIYAYKYTTMA
jgi:hypothetical protein